MRMEDGLNTVLIRLLPNVSTHIPVSQINRLVNRFSMFTKLFRNGTLKVTNRLIIVIHVRSSRKECSLDGEHWQENLKIYINLQKCCPKPFFGGKVRPPQARKKFWAHIYSYVITIVRKH